MKRLFAVLIECNEHDDFGKSSIGAALEDQFPEFHSVKVWEDPIIDAATAQQIKNNKNP